MRSSATGRRRCGPPSGPGPSSRRASHPARRRGRPIPVSAAQFVRPGAWGPRGREALLRLRSRPPHLSARPVQGRAELRQTRKIHSPGPCRSRDRDRPLRLHPRTTHSCAPFGRDRLRRRLLRRARSNGRSSRFPPGHHPDDNPVLSAPIRPRQTRIWCMLCLHWRMPKTVHRAFRVEGGVVPAGRRGRDQRSIACGLRAAPRSASQRGPERRLTVSGAFWYSASLCRSDAIPVALPSPPGRADLPAGRSPVTQRRT